MIYLNFKTLVIGLYQSQCQLRDNDTLCNPYISNQLKETKNENKQTKNSYAKITTYLNFYIMTIKSPVLHWKVLENDCSSKQRKLDDVWDDWEPKWRPEKKKDIE